MLKKLCVVFIMVCLIIPLTPPIQASAIQESTRQEGAVFHVSLVGVAQLDINPVKTISRTQQGTVKSASFDLNARLFPGPINLPRLVVDRITVPVPGDPDNVEVSRDLGWGGLDTIVTVFDAVTQKNVPVELHVYWWATSRVYPKGGRFVRDARIEGTLKYPGYTWDLAYISDLAIQTHLPGGFVAYIWSSNDPR
jgi:hypothetical protein